MFCGKCGTEVKDNAAAFCPECGAPMAAPSPEKKGFHNIVPMENCPYDISRVWPEWTPVKQIGRGSYGVVYEAVRNDSRVESRAAIKVISIPEDTSEVDSLRSEGLDEGRSMAYFKDIVDDFVREIEVMESLKGLANIVSVEDYKVIEKKDAIGWEIYIRMELLTPLNTYLCDKKLSEQDVIALGMDICTALEYCSKRNIIHRDIKPENIFINDLGCFKLGDFGIAKRLENMSDALTHQKGTLNYMAPEVAHGKEYDSRVDLYSLGLVLYKLLNGNILPFLDPNKQLLSASERKNAVERRLKGEPMPAPVNASTEMADLVLCVCENDPKLRYSTAAEMKKGLQSILDGNYVPYTPRKANKASVNAAPAGVVSVADKIPLKDNQAQANPKASFNNAEKAGIKRGPDNFVPVNPVNMQNRGNVMNDQPPPVAVQPPVSSVYHEKKKKGKAGLIIGIILGIIVLIASIIGGVFLYSHYFAEEEETTIDDITTTEEPAILDEETSEVGLEEFESESVNSNEYTTYIYIPVTEPPTKKPENTTKEPVTTERVTEPVTNPPVQTMPSTKSEIFNFFKTSANAIKNSGAAGFTRKQWHSIGSISTGYPLADSLVRGAVDKLLKNEDSAKTSSYSKGSSGAMSNFPGCSLSDASQISYASCTKSGSNYVITITMPSVDTPSRSGNLSRISNSVVYVDTIQSVISSSVESVSDVHLWYRNYTITAVMTPDGKFVSISHSANLELTIGEVYVGGLSLSNVTGSMTMNCQYTNFVY